MCPFYGGLFFWKCVIFGCNRILFVDAKEREDGVEYLLSGDGVTRYFDSAHQPHG